MLPKLQEAVLLAVLRRGPDCTAGDVQEVLTEAKGAEQSFGAVFTTLERLFRKKYVSWRRGEPEPKQGGRAPRLYTLTGLGRSALSASLQADRALGRAAAPGLLPDLEGV
jgi:PadR family transcriptional regulator PadR